MNKVTVFHDKNDEISYQYSIYAAQICGPSKIFDINSLDEEKIKNLSRYLIFCIPIFYNNSFQAEQKEYISLVETTIQKLKSNLANSFIDNKQIDVIKKIKEYLYLNESKDIYFVFIRQYIDLPSEKKELVNTNLFIDEINSLSNFINGFILLGPNVEERDLLIDYLRNIRIQTLYPKKTMNQVELSSLILKFILEHEVCVLATGYKDYIRSTTLEYIFKNFKFYIISEAGEKYANLACNRNVALTIFDSIPLSGRTKSIQVQGMANIFSHDDEKIKNILDARGLNKENIEKLGFDIFIIEIEPKSIELYDPTMKDLGYSNRQIFNPINFFNY